MRRMIIAMYSHAVKIKLCYISRLPPTWPYDVARKIATLTCPAKTPAPPIPTLFSTAPPSFAGFHACACHSPEGADLLATGTILSEVESAQGRCIYQVHTYNLCDRGRPLIVIDRSIHMIPTVLADDQCKICLTQSRQLICLFH